ncbi:DUF1353 domain-containing protein [Sphingomonas quercus]|uniref:DUF1353 domain-containing protein n=1 Tax=Sphingomonas quercus TaxID=2842451 RepID=A0ABS6BM62_9SPHN|nr:DUF1353 domain-containing protein [Sphingomonas quercus]MBU3078927.1 DUF1353 domain-containing protein [Sphingomonas quercus]
MPITSLSPVRTCSDLAAAIQAIGDLFTQATPAIGLEGAAPAPGFGHYDGLPSRVEFSDEGRNATLLAPISYTRPDGSAWPVPLGSALDGASIPRVFWSLIGGPFEGRYLNASIVHDHYCDARSRPWRDTHRMFHDAMRCSGVSAVQAKIMFYAVYRFGPRWNAPGVALEGALEAMRQPGDADAATLVADSEAIVGHGLNLAEIEALADARDTVRAAVEGALDAPAERIARARLLVVTGGSGTGEDLEAVAREAASLPDAVMARFEDLGIRIIACREAVTDFETGLRGVVPRGWENTGRTWDDVPGTYLDDRKRVVIATIAGPAGERVVPTAASGKHGSASLVVHESLHGHDYSGRHQVIRAAGFQTARDGDLARLGVYESQPGDAGLEETFAESGARFCVESAALHGDWPNLFGYWEAAPLAAGPVLESPLAVAEPDPAAPIGTAELRDDGAIRLDLRAEGPGGAIGHAAFVIARTDIVFPAVRDHLFAGGALEAAPGRVLPFRPMPASR